MRSSIKKMLHRFVNNETDLICIVRSYYPVFAFSFYMKYRNLIHREAFKNLTKLYSKQYFRISLLSCYILIIDFICLYNHI